MDGMDPAKRQYLIFSFIITLLIAIVINFMFTNLLQGTFITGFPIQVGDASGAEEFGIKVMNTIIFTVLLTFPMYLFIMWFINRR
jgi:hypothetical protein